MNTVIYSQPGPFKKVIFSRQVGSRDGLGNPTVSMGKCQVGSALSANPLSGKKCKLVLSPFSIFTIISPGVTKPQRHFVLNTKAAKGRT